MDKAKRDQQTTAIMNKFYDKRFNILIHGVQESADYTWENPEQTLAHIYEFMKDGLQIENPSEIVKLPLRTFIDCLNTLCIMPRK